MNDFNAYGKQEIRLVVALVALHALVNKDSSDTYADKVNLALAYADKLLEEVAK